MAMNNLGRVAMVHKGDYSATYEYVPLDCCYSDGSTYLCKETTLGNAPPNALYWILMSTSASTVDRDAAAASALAAAGSATSAAEQVTLAAAQVTLAEGHVTTASGHATTAGTQASAASDSAAAALASAGDADVSAGEAASSATAAATSASQAAVSAASVDGPGLLAAVAAKIDRYELPRNNILHNWDFRNPVNQRGVSGTINTTGYFLDRWLLVTGSVTIGTGLTIATSAVIEQRIEGLLLAGQQVTLSVLLADGTVKQATGVFPVDDINTTTMTIDGFGSGILGYNPGYLYVRLLTSGDHTVHAVKLERGVTSTLALDPPADMTEELPKCMRFFMDIGYKPFFYGFANSTTTISAQVTIPVLMRVSPTWNATTVVAKFNGSNINFTPSFTGVANSTTLKFSMNGTGLTANYHVFCHFGDNINICLSADL